MKQKTPVRCPHCRQLFEYREPVKGKTDDSTEFFVAVMEDSEEDVEDFDYDVDTSRPVKQQPSKTRKDFRKYDAVQVVYVCRYPVYVCRYPVYVCRYPMYVCIM